MLLGVIPTLGYGVLLPTGNDSLTRESNVNCVGANFTYKVSHLHYRFM